MNLSRCIQRNPGFVRSDSQVPRARMQSSAVGPAATPVGDFSVLTRVTFQPHSTRQRLFHLLFSLDSFIHRTSPSLTYKTDLVDQRAVAMAAPLMCLHPI